jgi:hypothetical protein
MGTSGRSSLLSYWHDGLLNNRRLESLYQHESHVAIVALPRFWKNETVTASSSNCMAFQIRASDWSWMKKHPIRFATFHCFYLEK